MCRPALDRDTFGWRVTRPTVIGSQDAGTLSASEAATTSRGSTGIETGAAIGTGAMTVTATGIVTVIGTMTASAGSSQPLAGKKAASPYRRGRSLCDSGAFFACPKKTLLFLPLWTIL